MGFLVSLLRVVSSSGKIVSNIYTTSYIANKLFKLILALQSFYQVGSSFIKNCLLSIGNLMIGVDELKIDDKYVNLLSVLCGHTDLEIRAFSWSILLKISSKVSGAEKLIQGRLISILFILLMKFEGFYLHSQYWINVYLVEYMRAA